MGLRSNTLSKQPGQKSLKIASWIGMFATAVVLALIWAYITQRPVVMVVARSAYHAYKARNAAPLAAIVVYRADSPIVIYKGGLASDWQDWSWAKHDMAETSVTYDAPKAISMVPAAAKGLYFHHGTFGTDGYGDLQLYVCHPGQIKVLAVDADTKFNAAVSLQKYLIGAASKGWFLVQIPLRDLGVPGSRGRISGIVFQSATQSIQLPMYLDDITLVPDISLPEPPTNITVPVSINLHADVHPISPYIYGLAQAPGEEIQDLHTPLNRWGGEDKTRYNWVQGNAENAARDYFFANKPAISDVTAQGPSSAADYFINSNLNYRCRTLITIPTIGWVAANDNVSVRSIDVPSSSGPPLKTVDGAIEGYDPTKNREMTSVPSFARKPGPFSDTPSTEGPVYQDEWVHHLVTQFGTAKNGGVAIYAMDNEPDVWDGMHTDVHPARMGYDDILSMFLNYSSAVKDVDPTCEVTGPVSFGWTSLYYSSLDRGTDNFKTHADRNNHGGVPFIPWFLKKVHDHDVKTGHRSLDVLDVHNYPQGGGVFSPAVDHDTSALRLRATASLWNPKYVDESWIGAPVDLIPRLRDWISDNYPGTKIGISEWNFGAENSINGALAIADVLGIYGREGVYLANFWAYPEKDKAGYLAFKLFTNADDKGHGFGDTSVHAVSSDTNSLSVFAARDKTTGLLTIMFVNKLPKTSITAPIIMSSGLVNDRIVDDFQLSADAPSDIQHLTVLRGVVPNAVTLPPYSITLFRIATGDDSN